MNHVAKAVDSVNLARSEEFTNQQYSTVVEQIEEEFLRIDESMRKIEEYRVAIRALQSHVSNSKHQIKLLRRMKTLFSRSALELRTIQEDSRKP